MSINQNPPATEALRYQDDEISLIDLWDTLWSQKTVIVVVTLIVTLVAAVYAFLGPKTYETDAVLLPPELSEISELNAPGVNPVLLESVYSKFTEKVASPDIYMAVAGKEGFKEYFYETENVSEWEVLKDIKEQYRVTLPEEPKRKLMVDASKAIVVSFQAAEAELSYTFLNEVIGRAQSAAKADIRRDIIADLKKRIDADKKRYDLDDAAINVEVSSEIERLLEADRLTASELKKQIEFLHKKAEQDRQYRIARLEESLAVAKTLGISTPINPIDYQKAKGGVEAKIDLASREPVGYWLGTDILSAEIESLRSRKSDSPFIGELTELNKKLSMLKTNERVAMLKARQSNLPFSETLRNIKKEISTLETAVEKINQAEFKVFRYSQRPVHPTKPIKPKKAIVLLIAMILGGMLGVFIALIRNAVNNRKQALAGS
jgi:LPS O-antigen subunit length determinant protein (WzzB/FepE family)